jgi:hypothetical protein
LYDTAAVVGWAIPIKTAKYSAAACPPERFVMSLDRPFYGLANFSEGSWVRIADRAVLEEFKATWKLHHRLEPEQLAFASQTAKVQRISMYHGGDILCELENIPGIWHQRLLGPTS